MILGSDIESVRIAVATKITEVASNTIVWSKKPTFYDILDKDDNLVWKIRPEALPDRIRNGDISYVFGHKIVIPYTDPIDHNTYDLPFMFATTRHSKKKMVLPLLVLDYNHYMAYPREISISI